MPSLVACLHLAHELPGMWLQEVYLSPRLVAAARGAPPQPPAHSHFTLRCALHRLHSGSVWLLRMPAAQSYRAACVVAQRFMGAMHQPATTLLDMRWL